MAPKAARWVTGSGLIAYALMLGMAMPVVGATKTWNGAGSSNDWSDDGVGGNWNGDAAPVTTVDDVLFNNDGADGTFGTATSVLDISPMSLTGLVFASTTGNTHTVDLNGNTLAVLGDVRVNYDVIGQTTLAGFTDTIGGGALSIGNGSQAIAIGRRLTNTSGNMSGRLDLSAVDTVNIDVATITMSDNDTGQVSTTGATLNFGMTNTVLADTFYVGRRKSTADVDIVSGGTLNLGSNVDRTNLLISYGDLNTSFDAASNFDMSAGKLVAFLNNLTIGAKTTGASNGDSIGTFTMSADAGNSVDVNNVVLGDWDATGNGLASGKITMLGGTFTVNNNLVRGDAAGSGASDSAVQVSGGTMNVAGDFKVDTVDIGYNGRTGLITAGGEAQVGSGSEIMNIGRRNSSSGGTTNGTLDLSAANSTDINVGDLRLGTQETSNDTVNGTLKLSAAGTNTLSADTIRLGYIAGGNTGSTVGNIEFGGAANNVSVDSFIVGHDKATGHVSIAAGGVLTLGGKSGAEADLLIGDNAAVGTGTSPVTSTFNLSGASASSVLTLDELVVGRYGSTGVGGGKGSLSMDAGTINANSVVVAFSTGANPGNTAGTINLNGGMINVVNSITNGAGSATLNVNGAAALSVGGTAGFDTVNIGSPGGNTGTLDTTGGSPFNLTATTLNLGVTTSSAAQGTLVLASISSIAAATLTIGDSTSSGQDFIQSKITLGTTTTTIAADTITLGGRKSIGRVEFNGSGTLALGSSGDRIDNLYVGYNSAVTGTNAVGHFDGTNGTINAFVDNMVLGHHAQSTGSLGTGSGAGTLTLEAGVFDVNTLTLGNAPSTTSTATGTVNLSGGTLRAGTIQHGATIGNSVANFNFTGGRLAVDNFAFTLDQDGGILAPGDSPGSTLITGDYNLNAGSIEIQLDGLSPVVGYDQVTVTGVATLASASVVDVLLGFSPNDSTYDVLIADEIVDNGVIVNLPGVLGWSYAIIDDFDGFNDVLRLSFVAPEPTTLMLLLPSVMGVCRRRGPGGRGA